MEEVTAARRWGKRNQKDFFARLRLRKGEESVEGHESWEPKQEGYWLGWRLQGILPKEDLMQAGGGQRKGQEP